MASAGVAVTYGVIRMLGSASSALVLIGAALFLALGLEPAVSTLVNRKLPRWAAVTLVVVVVFGVVAGVVAAAVDQWKPEEDLCAGRRTVEARRSGV